MRIVVLSDTHIPRVTQDLPKEIYDSISEADMIIHAGDFIEKDFYLKLKGMKETTAVYGNMDAMNLGDLLNRKEVIQAGKFKIGLIHGYGAPNDMLQAVKKEFTDVDAIVFGHTHIPLNLVKDGILFFNPGSPTDKVFATVNSYGILEITDKKIEGKIIKLR
ncbi:MAG: metallophosphoesterase family protein [Candidatus Omnitrophota bacterium]|nr:metallophosphoesterase family protein [Candidatus Omnitrophota bacterium]